MEEEKLRELEAAQAETVRKLASAQRAADRAAELQSLSPSLRTYVSENPNADIASLKYMEEQRIKDNLAAQEMNFEETIVGKLTELYQTVHLKEFTDFPKKDEKDPTTVFTDIHFEKKSIAHEAYHLSHGYCQWIDWVTFSGRRASNGRSRPGGVERETY